MYLSQDNLCRDALDTNVHVQHVLQYPGRAIIHFLIHVHVGNAPINCMPPSRCWGRWRFDHKLQYLSIKVNHHTV